MRDDFTMSSIVCPDVPRNLLTGQGASAFRYTDLRPSISKLYGFVLEHTELDPSLNMTRWIGCCGKANGAGSVLPGIMSTAMLDKRFCNAA